MSVLAPSTHQIPHTEDDVTGTACHVNANFENYVIHLRASHKQELEDMQEACEEAFRTAASPPPPPPPPHGSTAGHVVELQDALMHQKLMLAEYQTRHAAEIDRYENLVQIRRVCRGA